MKKLTLLTALAVAGVAQAAPYTGHYDGKVIFNGEVIDQTCTVVTDKATQTVVLEKVPAAKLSAPGKIAGGKPFQIELQGCKTNSTHQLVRAEFRTSPNVDSATYTLKNTYSQADKANNVNLRLKEFNGTPIEIGNPTYAGHQYEPLNQQATGAIKYSVEYYATGNATAGKVESEVEYSIVYQ